jgi:hydroxymethylbilane synthase
MAALTRPLLIGTRDSALARRQANWVRAQLRAAWPNVDCRLKAIMTTGDRLLDQPLPEIGGKGVFTEELENALRAEAIDLAVHSLKDLPLDGAPGLRLGAICAREDARDVLVSASGWTLAALPDGARVGTSSPRRAAQLLAARPDLTPLALRGNVDTRLRKAMSGDYDAIVLAAAGVLRLGLSDHITQYLPFDLMLPAPGQGALAVQCRADDGSALELLHPLEDDPTRAAVSAERAFLDGLGGGCSAPVAAYAQVRAADPLLLQMTGLVASPDGRHIIRVSGMGTEPAALGTELARQALAQGAGERL